MFKMFFLKLNMKESYEYPKPICFTQPMLKEKKNYTLN